MVCNQFLPVNMSDKANCLLPKNGWKYFSEKGKAMAQLIDLSLHDTYFTQDI